LPKKGGQQFVHQFLSKHFTKPNANGGHLHTKQGNTGNLDGPDTMEMQLAGLQWAEQQTVM